MCRQSFAISAHNYFSHHTILTYKTGASGAWHYTLFVIRVLSSFFAIFLILTLIFVKTVSFFSPGHQTRDYLMTPLQLLHYPFPIWSFTPFDLLWFGPKIPFYGSGNFTGWDTEPWMNPLNDPLSTRPSIVSLLTIVYLHTYCCHQHLLFPPIVLLLWPPTMHKKG